MSKLDILSSNLTEIMVQTGLSREKTKLSFQIKTITVLYSLGRKYFLTYEPLHKGVYGMINCGWARWHRGILGCIEFVRNPT